MESQLAQITTSVISLAEQHQGDTLALLSILRTLEKLHRQIQEGSFQDSLPENRQALYALLRDIEESGGWPYIDRMRLRGVMARLLEGVEVK
jgi:hypothetical protein